MTFLGEGLFDIRIRSPEKLFATREELGRHTDSGKEGSHFNSDEAAADDNETFRNWIRHRKQVVAGPDGKLGVRRGRRVRAGGYDNLISG